MTIRVERRGSRADHGMYHIDLKGIRAEWREDESALVLSANNVEDFSSSAATHDYKVFMPLDVVRTIARLYVSRLNFQPALAAEIARLAEELLVSEGDSP